MHAPLGGGYRHTAPMFFFFLNSFLSDRGDGLPSRERIGHAGHRFVRHEFCCACCLGPSLGILKDTSSRSFPFLVCRPGWADTTHATPLDYCTRYFRDPTLARYAKDRRTPEERAPRQVWVLVWAPGWQGRGVTTVEGTVDSEGMGSSVSGAMLAE